MRFHNFHHIMLHVAASEIAKSFLTAKDYLAANEIPIVSDPKLRGILYQNSRKTNNKKHLYEKTDNFSKIDKK